MRRRRNNDKKNIIVAIIFLMIVFMTAGYAAYSRDLIINSSGKIYNDWDVRFTDISLNETNSSLYDELRGTYDDHPPVVAADGLSLSLYAGLLYPTDEIYYDIDITNFSEMWDAEYTGAIFSTDSGTDYILYEILDLTTGDKIAVDTSGGINPNVKKIRIKAYWNPAKLTPPPGTTMLYDTTYTEDEVTITLVFESAQP